MVGYAKIKDKEKLHNFIESNLPTNDSYSRIYRGGWYWNNYQDIDKDIKDKDYKTNIFDDLNWTKTKTKEFWDMITHIEKEGQRLICFKRSDIACVVGYSDHKFLMPIDFFDIDELKDYSMLTVSELKAIGGSVAVNTNLPANLDDVNRGKLNDIKSEYELKAEELKNQAKDIKDAKTGELAEIQKKIEEMQEILQKKQEVLMAELDKKKAELAEQQAILNNQIYMLDTQIYSIRCYLGEIIDFKKITNGKGASAEEPLFICQKIRYINEELGKYMGMYNIPITEESSDTFIEILKNRVDLRHLFSPYDKCITILKASRTGTYKGVNENFANTLKDYERYHGKQIAILVRNGDNFYIGWTDEEKIGISDENVFYVPKTDSFTGADEDTIETKSSRSDMVSRMFILSIIQGIKDNTNMISLPKDVNIFKPNEYIVFSAAEGWIEDHTYGTYEEILNKSKDIPLKEGDYILTTMNIGRDDGFKERYDSYNNNRGIGEKNRTHDAHIPGLKVLPINKVLYDAVIEYEIEKYKAVIDENKKSPYPDSYYYKATNELIGTDKTTYEIDFETWREIKKNHDDNTEYLINYFNRHKRDYLYCKNMVHSYIDNAVNGEIENAYVIKAVGVKTISYIPHYFISVNSGNYWSGDKYKVNMEIYDREYHPLTYLCPTWIKYCIKTGNIGYIRLCGADMTYADLLQDFNIMLEHLNKVQEQEKKYLIKAGLQDWINKIPNWDVVLTEWRITNKKRKLTETSARAFAKYIKS